MSIPTPLVIFTSDSFNSNAIASRLLRPWCMARRAEHNTPDSALVPEPNATPFLAVRRCMAQIVMTLLQCNRVETQTTHTQVCSARPIEGREPQPQAGLRFEH
eukprot:5809253-Amphidinium_carterae.1